MDCIDRVYDIFEDQKYKFALKCAEKIKKKVKNMRQVGLEGIGIYSIENLAFKILRNNGLLEILSTLKTISYDKMMSTSDISLKIV